MASVSGMELPEEISNELKGMMSSERGSKSNTLFLVLGLKNTAEPKFNGDWYWQILCKQEKAEEISKKKQVDQAEFQKFYEPFYELLVQEEQKPNAEKVPLFLLFDFDGLQGRRNVLCVQWCSDDCHIKKKMLYSTSVQPIKKITSSAHATTDLDDMKWPNVLSLAS